MKASGLLILVIVLAGAGAARPEGLARTPPTRLKFVRTAALKSHHLVQRFGAQLGSSAAAQPEPHQRCFEAGRVMRSVYGVADALALIDDREWAAAAAGELSALALQYTLAVERGPLSESRHAQVSELGRRVAAKLESVAGRAGD